MFLFHFMQMAFLTSTMYYSMLNIKEVKNLPTKGNNKAFKILCCRHDIFQEFAYKERQQIHIVNMQLK